MSFVPLAGGAQPSTSGFVPISATSPGPAVAAAAPQTFAQKLIGGVQKTASDVWGALTTPGPATTFNPVAIEGGFLGDLSKSLSAAGNQVVSNASAAFSDHQTAVQRGADVGEAAFGVLSGIFAPISSALTAGQQVPHYGQLFTGINNVFSALAVGGSDLADGALHSIPSTVLSDATKETLTPLVRDIGALTAQIVAGEAGDGAFKSVASKSKEVLDTVAKETGDASIVKAPVAEGEGGFTPISAEEGPKAPTEVVPGVPDVAQEQPAAAPTATPATETPEVSPAVAPAPAEAPTASSALPGTVETGPKTHTPEASAPVTEPATQTPSKIGKSIEQKAVDAKLTEGFSGTAGYDAITIKDQAERATKFVNESFDDARSVIRGEAPLPEGLRGTALITAMEERLATKPDADLAHELANSPLVSATSAAAQEMRLAAERLPDSITTKFREIKSAREAAVEKRGGMSKAVKSVVSDVQKEIARTASKRPEWEDFIKEIACRV